MDPAVLGTRLASSLVAPLVKKLFVQEGPGAGLVDRPVRISGLVSFRGEKRTLTDQDVQRLAARLVDQSLSSPGERPFPEEERTAVAHALARVLLALGDLGLNDIEAVTRGHRALAKELLRATPPTGLSADADFFLGSVTEWACLQILHFFTQRSTFVARSLVEQSRTQAELIVRLDELIARSPRVDALDARFERRYLAAVARKHNRLTIFGIDLVNSPGRWPLDAAYMSLEATARPSPDTSFELDFETLPSGSDPEMRASSLRESLGEALATFNQKFEAARPADQALADHDRVLLRGEAGSGKTTLVQWLAVSASAADPVGPDGRMTYLHDRIPYVLPLRTLTRHGERLPAPADFLRAVGSPLAGSQPTGWETRVLTSGRALVLVDGIDEIPESERSRTREWLGDLIDAYPGNRWLVTSRPSAVGEDWLAEQAFTELTLSPMSRSEVAAFIHRWHRAARAGTPEEDEPLLAYEGQLLEAVAVKPDLGRLATNPLMCGLICALHRDRRGFLPLGRKDLYAAALSMLLIRRDRERDMHVPELREEPQLQLLQRLAYWLIRNGRTVMDRSRAEAIIADALPAVPELAALGDAEAVYAHFLHRSGLLREPGPRTVDFIHRTFQDFLGARAAVDEGDFGFLARQAPDDQWEDVIRMAVAQARPRERAEIFRDLLEVADKLPAGHVRKRVHLLTAACLEHAAELAPAVRTEVEQRMSALIPPRNALDARELAAVGPMVLDLLPGPDGLDGLDDEDARHVAITATHVQSDAAIPFLARFARHPGIGVRSQLMWGWSRYDCRAYADQVISQLDDGVTHFVLRTDEQVAEITRLGLRPRHLDIREGVSPQAASHLLVACEPTFLMLKIHPARLTTEALGALRNLIALRVFNVYEPWSLSLFPPDAPLRTLGIFEALSHLTDLRHMDRWPGLKWVIFGESDLLNTGEAWEPLTRLPQLTELSLASASFACAPSDLRLPDISLLQLFPTGGQRIAASRIPRILPGLKALNVLPSASPTTFDVAPLAQLPALEQLRVPVPGVTGLDAIPADVDVVTYHPFND
ncbi:NACHT domain-containing protein [Streptomyces sp. NBC_01283]|uniref:NACHT domain-containing protein n=1 Tax=Streptomyces sp. NBC_01283 TaxID=2903812 RepID=UPI00352C2910|nr:NACHT domain-containing protein [Streptomyces sp. NBC_01283]